MQFNNTSEFVGYTKINDATKRFDQTKIEFFYSGKE